VTVVERRIRFAACMYSVHTEAPAALNSGALGDEDEVVPKLRLDRAVHDALLLGTNTHKKLLRERSEI
jgi:hypothetical protein